jgi:hypothetical protein
LARISPFRESPYFASSLKGSYFAQPLQVARGLAELGCQKCLDEIQAMAGPTVRPPMQRIFIPIRMFVPPISFFRVVPAIVSRPAGRANRIKADH